MQGGSTVGSRIRARELCWVRIAEPQQRSPLTPSPFVSICSASPSCVGPLSQLGQDPLLSPPLRGGLARPLLSSHHLSVTTAQLDEHNPDPSPGPCHLLAHQVSSAPPLGRDSLCLSRSRPGLLSQPPPPNYSLLPRTPFPRTPPLLPILSSQPDQDFLQSPFRSGPGLLCHPHSSSFSLPYTFYCHLIVNSNFTVQFSNGKLRNPGNMRFTLYKNNDSTNPRKKSQRILVGAPGASYLHSAGLRTPLGCGCKWEGAERRKGDIPRCPWKMDFLC